jgi:hypothetical protein
MKVNSRPAKAGGTTPIESSAYSMNTLIALAVSCQVLGASGSGSPLLNGVQSIRNGREPLTPVPRGVTLDRLEARAEREFDLAALSSGDIMIGHLLTVRR